VAHAEAYFQQKEKKTWKWFDGGKEKNKYETLLFFTHFLDQRNALFLFVR